MAPGLLASAAEYSKLTARFHQFRRSILLNCESTPIGFLAPPLIAVLLAPTDMYVERCHLFMRAHAESHRPAFTETSNREA